MKVSLTRTKEKLAPAPPAENSAQQAANADAMYARGLWITRHMMDLPSAYREQLPIEVDPDRLMAAEQEIRQEYRADMKRHAPYNAGALAVNPDGSLHGPMAKSHMAEMGARESALEMGVELGAPAATEDEVDISKLSNMEKLALGLKQSSAGRGGGQAASLADSPMTDGMTSMQKMALGLSQSRPARRR